MKTKHLLTAILLMGVAVFLGASSARAQAGYFAVTTYADGVDAKPGDGICATAAGECTLRAAIQEANLGDPAWIQTIVLEPGEYLLSIPGAGEEGAAAGDLDVKVPVEIEGPLAQPTTGPFAFIDGGGLDRVLHVHFGATVHISGVVVRNGQAQDSDGGGILNEGKLEFVVGQISANTIRGSGNGGGIFNSAQLMLSGVTVSGNSSTLGGGIFNALEMDLSDATVSQNKVDGEGAGIFNAKRAKIRGIRVDINDNHAVGSYGGGGVCNQGSFEVGESTITGNSAGWSGGGVANTGTMKLTNTTVSQNTSLGTGGGLYNSGTLDVSGGSIEGNSAVGGGGIENYSTGNASLQRVTISTNTAKETGGGLENSGFAGLAGVTLANNSAMTGGGLSNAISDPNIRTQTWIYESTILSNSAADMGGGIANYRAMVSVGYDSVIKSNTALLGGGLVNWVGNVDITDSYVTGNGGQDSPSSETYGGGVFNTMGLLSFYDATVNGNSAGYGGGIFNDGGEVNIEYALLESNLARVSGGGIYDQPSSLVEGLRLPGALSLRRPERWQSEGGMSRADEADALEAGVWIRNSTLSGNQAGAVGGGINTTHKVDILLATLAENSATEGSALFSDVGGAVVVGNSILVAPDGSRSVCSGEGSLLSRGFNLENQDTCALTAKGDQVNTDALLGPLAENESLAPIHTRSHALLPGSPAIDSGSNILCGAVEGGTSMDQRFEFRPMDGNHNGGAVCDLGAYEANGPYTSFGDVSSGHWAFGYIEWLYDLKYVAGCSADPRLYCPDVGMNRAEASVFVERGARGAGYEPAEPSSSYFTDVPLGLWFTRWVQQLWVDGFTAGCGVDQFGNRQFCPYWPHSRAEATVFFTRMRMGAKYEPPAPTRQIFADVPIGAGAPWYSAWVNAAYEAGIIGTCEDIQFREAGMFHPNAELRRSEGACMMINALGRGLAFPTSTVVTTPTTARTPTPTQMASGTVVATPTATRTPTATGTATRTAFATPTATRTSTPTRTATRTTVATPTATRTSTRALTPTPTPTSGGDIWRPTANVPIHWQWQIGTPLNTSRDLVPYVTVYDIDAFENDASTVSYLHSQGFKVIGYVSFGSWEDWRPDASAFPSSVLGRSNGWPGERWLDIRSDAVKTIMAARLDVIKQKGFDGVEPDNIDGYSNNTGFPLTAQDQIDYNRWIAEQSHARGLSVGLKNDVEQAAALQPFFEWTLNEECYQYSECDGLQVFTNANKAVFQVEYSGTGQCSTMRSMHFNSMTRDLDLVGPNDSGYTRTPCIPDAQNTW